MATPLQGSQPNHPAPSTEATKDAAGVTVAYRVSLVLTGTNANIAADWATLLATVFASAAVISWDRA
jgi:hypothetical protein